MNELALSNGTFIPPAQQNPRSVAENGTADKRRADGRDQHSSRGNIERIANERALLGMSRLGQLLNGGIEHLRGNDRCDAERQQTSLDEVHLEKDCGDNDQHGANRMLRERLIETAGNQHSAERVTKSRRDASEHRISKRIEPCGEEIGGHGVLS